jgi:predicted acetyltransferase
MADGRPELLECTMTALARPDARLHSSWAAAMSDFGSEFPHGSGIWHQPDGGTLDLTEAGCAEFVATLLPFGNPETELSDDLVHCDYYWITDGSGADVAVVGFLALRHRLTAWLFEEGGHIGYSVRPSRRGEGHASRALGLAVRRSAELGLARVLVTCDEPNDASARTIERNGGVQEDVRNGKRRYWISTGISGEPDSVGRSAEPA